MNVFTQVHQQPATLASPATSAERRKEAGLLSVHAASGHSAITNLSELPRFFEAGDVLVVNNAATIPASLSLTHVASGTPLELRLLTPREVLLGESEFSWHSWLAAAFSQGSWRQRTEERTQIPLLRVGDLFATEDPLVQLEITGFHNNEQRLPEVGFRAAEKSLRSFLFKHGRPIQYSYHKNDLELWDVQTPFATQPVATEAPSASFHLSWELMFALQERGVRIVPVTHATGVSSLGEPELDRLLPVPEFFAVGQEAREIIVEAQAINRQVIGLGTGAARAVESAFGGEAASSGSTSLLLSGTHRLRGLTGLLTGMHEMGSSHLRLLDAFVPRPWLLAGYEKAVAAGFLWHEFGDLCLISEKA